MNNLADVHTLQGRCAAAESLYRQALSILEDSLGPDHPEVAYGLTHLARVSFLQARFTESEALLHWKVHAPEQCRPARVRM